MQTFMNMVPHMSPYGSSGVPAVPATLFRSGREAGGGYITCTLARCRPGEESWPPCSRIGKEFCWLEGQDGRKDQHNPEDNACQSKSLGRSSMWEEECARGCFVNFWLVLK